MQSNVGASHHESMISLTHALHECLHSTAVLHSPFFSCCTSCTSITPHTHTHTHTHTQHNTHTFSTFYHKRAHGNDVGSRHKGSEVLVFRGQARLKLQLHIVFDVDERHQCASGCRWRGGACCACKRKRCSNEDSEGKGLAIGLHGEAEEEEEEEEQILKEMTKKTVHMHTEGCNQRTVDPLSLSSQPPEAHNRELGVWKVRC